MQAAAKRAFLLAAAGVLVIPSGAPAAAGSVPVEATFIFGGDVLVHSQLWRQAAQNVGPLGRERGVNYDFRPMFGEIRRRVRSADVAICHLETPIVPSGERLSTFPRFGVPAEIAPALADAGFDRCSTASNHSLDRGMAGIQATIAALEGAGISQAGMARNRGEIAPTIQIRDGLVYSHLSYTFGYNDGRSPDGERSRSALIDPRRIIADARAARAQGARVVIASLHWGVERRHEVSSYQRDVARALARSGAVDLVVGHHAHVLQPIEQIEGMWVIFGLSNLLSNMPTDSRWPEASQDGALVEVTLRVDEDIVSVKRPIVHPTWVDKKAGFVVREAIGGGGRADLAEGVRRSLHASLARTMKLLGAFVPKPGRTET
jgi:poly-gamma-glutamate synthesis protein (capsule biosynthesis protein)